MAETILSYDTGLNRERCLSDEEDGVEKEYDAKNDETFGACEDSKEDWEEEHEQFAEIEEISKLSENLGNCLSRFVYDDDDGDSSFFKHHKRYDEKDDGGSLLAHTLDFHDSFPHNLIDDDDSPPSSFDDSVWSFKDKLQDDLFSSPIQNSFREESKQESKEKTDFSKIISMLQKPPVPKMCTLEELERSLLTNKVKLPPPLLPGPPIPPPRYPGMYQHHMPPRVPPGLAPVPPLRHMPPLGPYNVPPGVMRIMPPPHFMQNNPPPHPPGFVFQGNNQFPVGHPFNFPPPPRNMMGPNNMPMNKNVNHGQQNRQRHDSASSSYRGKNCGSVIGAERERDEYAGLMTNREKQWLLNIQLLQLNTGTPYFDDYYYTVFKSRKNLKKISNDRNDRNHYNNRYQQRDGHHRNMDRQDNQNTLQPRIYTPLQFENSLGKLQCGSVTAPRKIIDMDVVATEKDSENQVLSKDTRKSKQILLELESLYTLFLKAVDLKNPLAINDMEKLRELKQKQRLRELEAAPTPEQKQEVLKLLQKESVPVVEDQNEYLSKILNGLLREEKFASYFKFSKGKMLVIRLLPHLPVELFSVQLKDLWSKVLLSIPLVGRRDAIGDNILPKFYPSFRSHVERCKMSDLLDLATVLSEIVTQENSRATPCPLSHHGRSPLYFIVNNKFGISALCTTIVRVEHLISADQLTEKQLENWSKFLETLAKVVQNIVNNSADKNGTVDGERVPPVPIERITRDIFSKHLERFKNVTADGRSLLENVLVDARPVNSYFS